MRSQTRWITAAVAAAMAALAIGQASAQSYGYSSNNGYANGYSRSVRCESTNSRQVLCRVNTQGGVRIVRQLSHSPCRQGRNWNYDSRGIWVSGGCRADFAISSRRQYNRDGSYTSNGYYSGSGDSRYGNDRNDYRDSNDDYRNNDDQYDDSIGDGYYDSGYYRQR